MKKYLLVVALVISSFTFTVSTNADWFGGGNNGEWKQGPYGPYWDESDWPEWTPMYWMEEFMDEFSNNNWGSNNWGNSFGGYNNVNPYNYNFPQGGYNSQSPYYYAPNGGYTYPQTYVAPSY